MDGLDNRLLLMRPLLFLVIFVFLDGAPTSAEVWQRLPGDATVNARDAITAYSSRVTINGGDADLKVLSYSANLRSVMKGLDNQYAKRSGGLFMNGDSIGIGIVHQAHTITRLLVLELRPENRCLVFTLNQSIVDYSRSETSPTHHLLTRIPHLPGSRPNFFMKDNGTQLSLEVSTTPSDSASAQSTMSSSLRQQGWVPMVPLERMPQSPGLMIYVKGREIAMVSVTTDTNTRQSTITLLHKTPALR